MLPRQINLVFKYEKLKLMFFFIKNLNQKNKQILEPRYTLNIAMLMLIIVVE